MLRGAHGPKGGDAYQIPKRCQNPQIRKGRISRLYKNALHDGSDPLYEPGAGKSGGSSYWKPTVKYRKPSYTITYVSPSDKEGGDLDQDRARKTPPALSLVLFSAAPMPEWPSRSSCATASVRSPRFAASASAMKPTSNLWCAGFCACAGALCLPPARPCPDHDGFRVSDDP
jgi:hypothetical protein